MCIASLVFRRFAADASVNYVATMPGLKGAAWAFSAEAVISFVMMLTVLVMSNAQRLARLTGVAAGVLVATFITFEAPLSGMSMNPARTVASALFAGGGSLWIYFTAPPLGMLAAAETFLRTHGRACAARSCTIRPASPASFTAATRRRQHEHDDSLRRDHHRQRRRRRTLAYAWRPRASES